MKKYNEMTETEKMYVQAQLELGYFYSLLEEVVERNIAEDGTQYKEIGEMNEFIQSALDYLAVCKKMRDAEKLANCKHTHTTQEVDAIDEQIIWDVCQCCGDKKFHHEPVDETEEGEDIPF